MVSYAVVWRELLESFMRIAQLNLGEIYARKSCNGINLEQVKRVTNALSQNENSDHGFLRPYPRTIYFYSDIIWKTSPKSLPVKAKYIKRRTCV